MARRPHLTLMLVVGVMLFLSMTWKMSGNQDYPTDLAAKSGSRREPTSTVAPEDDRDRDHAVPQSILAGGSIAPKLDNATVKYTSRFAVACPPPADPCRAELGRASWKVLHTMMARFPEKPSADDSLALKTFVQLFGRLYPCGDCARHFRKLLDKYPPQTSSRNAAAGWACFVHNQVNKRLQKKEFDCNKIGDFYDCGCGDDDKKEAAKTEDLKERKVAPRRN